MTVDRVVDLATGGAYLPPPGADQPVQAAILALIGVWRLTGPNAGERRALLDRIGTRWGHELRPEGRSLQVPKQGYAALRSAA